MIISSIIDIIIDCLMPWVCRRAPPRILEAHRTCGLGVCKVPT